MPIADATRNIPMDPTTALITQGIGAVTDITKQIIGGAQANKAARDDQTFKLDSQKEANRAQSVENSFSLVSDLRAKRFAEQEAQRNAEAEAANPLTTQTKYLMFGGAALLVVGLVITIIFLNK